MKQSIRRSLLSALMLIAAQQSLGAAENDSKIKARAAAAMRTAAVFYRERVASHGGYVYHYSLDLKRRWGEGEATQDQIWVQPPGTPTVGIAFLRAFKATGDRYYLDAARAAAEAIAYGQLRSGGWTNCIDFNPRGKRIAQYRNGKGRGKNNSSLDDGQTQSALNLLVQVDAALGFEHKQIHQAAMIGLDALLKAQFPNGAFPQVWTGPVKAQAVMRANYPDYDWRTNGRIKKYWNMYTLNDNVCGYVADTLIEAHRVYGGTKYKAALARLGDFLILAQMPDPQPGWAQQYNFEMQPIWARKFEPPGVSGDESQEVIETLMKISAETREGKYLEPITAALEWLEQSVLPDGQLARYYELKTNTPLYMFRRGKQYELTYDDSQLPAHYGWKTPSRVHQLGKQHSVLIRYGLSALKSGVRPVKEKEIRSIIDALDEQGRWISSFSGQRLVGQMKLPIGTKYISSEVFSANLTSLSAFLDSEDSQN